MEGQGGDGQGEIVNPTATRRLTLPTTVDRLGNDKIACI